jgi:alpha-tubulin suppressor-like RCC1 family protein
MYQFYYSRSLPFWCFLALIFLLCLSPTGAEASDLSGGSQHSLANGAADQPWGYAWGSNQSGQVGNPNAGRNRKFPIRWSGQTGAATASTATPSATNDDWAQVASGGQHSVARREDGTVWTWGKNDYGQLGDGTTANRQEPIQVNGLSQVIAVAAGKSHSLAVKQDGAVWAWGNNSSRQLGNNSSDTALKPTQVVIEVPGTDTSPPTFPPLTDVVAVSASEVHSVALKSDGTVWAWGDNRYGQLGTGNTFGSATAKQVPGLAQVQVITAGGDSTSARTLARTEDGALWGWGNNDECQFGQETAEEVKTPLKLAELARIGAISALASGLGHGIALTADGQVWTWGDNQNGQLGDGTSTSRCMPMPVSGVSEVERIAAGDRHTLMTQRDGTVRAWGKNEFGQLGDGTASDSGTPEAVKGVCGVGQLNLTGAPPAACLLTLSVAGKGTVSGGGNFADGHTVTLTATPDAGHYFARWTPAPCAASFKMPASNLVCTAQFFSTETVTSVLTLETAGDGRGAVHGAGRYAAGERVILTATADSGSLFDGWSPSPCNAAGGQFTMPVSDLTCTATFSDSAIKLITHYYVSILEREPEADGLAYWKGLIDERQAAREDAKPVFRDMASFFFNSPEYLARNTTDRQFITNLYLTFFQRTPDEGGYAFWLDQLAGGMTRNNAMAGFLYSPEFTTFMENLGF